METPISEIKKKQAVQNVKYGVDPAEEEAQKQRDRRKFYEEKPDDDAPQQVNKPSTKQEEDRVQLGVAEGQITDFKSKIVPSTLQEKQPYWLGAPGIDSAGKVIEQHRVINRSLKERALQIKTKKKFKNEIEGVYDKDDLLVPMNQVITEMPQNVLAPGSGITLGLTEEQKDEQQKAVLELRRVQNLNFQVHSKSKPPDPALLDKAADMLDQDDLSRIQADPMKLSANEKLRALQLTENYIEKFEQVLREREEEERWQKTRHQRFENMKNLMDNLKSNLISAAYPRGGGEHLKSDILGVKKDAIPDSRALDKFRSFKSLKDDPQV